MIRNVLAYFSILLIFGDVSAQTVNSFDPNFADFDYTSPKTYTLAQVNVVGAEQRDDNAIKSITGLREGNSITIPSEELGNSMKKLWNLRLFSDVEFILDSIVNEELYITINITEQPLLTRHIFINVKKGQQEKVVSALGETLRVGGIVTENDKITGAEKVKAFFEEKGYPDTEVIITEQKDTIRENAVALVFDVQKNNRIKIDNISFSGNVAYKDKRLRRLMKDTKKKGTFLKKSKFISSKYEEDKIKIIDHYHKNGFSDATIVGDSVWRGENGLYNLVISIDEGVQYKYGNITWKGNSIYTDEQLEAVLGINRGQVFRPEDLSKSLEFSLDGRDVSSLYMDNGYLFFNIDPKIIAVRDDTIDMEMRMYEGPQATIDRVSIKGNDRTHEEVIRRVLRTRPGEKFSRSDIVRSQREITNLGYFDPETLGVNTPVNYERGTVDIEYTVEERPADQLELSAGYGGFQGLIGTLGVTFNNFSIQNIRDRSTWSPLPGGDGQRLSFRLQSNSRFFRSLNFSFTEPWLGGKKPNSFSVGAASSSFDNSTFNQGKLGITRLFVGLGTSIKFPDDYFVSSTVLNIERINLDGFTGQFIVNDGNFRNFNISQTISRSSINNPLFPMSGSKVSLTVQFTPPYSLFRKDQFWLLTDAERDDIIFQENRRRGIRNKLDGAEAEEFLNGIEESRKFEWLEYHKWRFDAEWYFNIVDKLVFMTQIKMGFLGSYNKSIGDVPFERFEVGGDGLSNQNTGITGTDIIALRGYDQRDIDPNSRRTGGGIIFNKYTAELRYPLSTNPNSTIYASLFMQGGNQWNSFDDFNPFDVRRSVGIGVRVFLPMFGLLGFDYGFGLDKVIEDNPNPGLGALGKFNIILGFEPD